MSGSPENRVALVTGGARRVGRAIVETLAAAGFDVAFTYLHSSQEAAQLQARIRDLGRQCIAIQADLTEPVGAAGAISRSIRGAFGRLDVLVNNASLYIPESSPEDSRRMWAIHVESPLLLSRELAAELRASRGHVVNMVDLLAERPWPKYLAYSASKAGLWNLTLGLARQLAPEVTVNGIAPGVVEWPDDYPPADRERYLKRVPLGRPGTPQDVAQAVRFLCTAGSYVTGQIIRLDGGRSIT